jgi:hypothetical protein
MLGNPHGRTAEIAKRTDPAPFLGTHRALSVRQREFDRLTEAAVAALDLSTVELMDRPVVRRSPDRCLIQCGPVALTLAWLRHTLDSVAAGELLVVVWRGLVAPGGRVPSDRTTSTCTPVRSATVEWEEVLRVVALDEPSWMWRPVGADIGGYRSAELAERCVSRLLLARAGITDDAGTLRVRAASPA